MIIRSISFLICVATVLTTAGEALQYEMDRENAPTSAWEGEIGGWAKLRPGASLVVIALLGTMLVVSSGLTIKDDSQAIRVTMMPPVLAFLLAFSSTILFPANPAGLPFALRLFCPVLLFAQLYFGRVSRGSGGTDKS
jgi:hypothetical protein